MPYNTASELPQSVRSAIPSANGKEIFRNVVNSQLKAGKSESVAFASAWAALQRAGYEKDGSEWIRKSRDAGLENKMKEHNDTAADGRKVTMSMLRQVYDRGVGAYRTNPQSVRPNVKSPEQWAMARVNSFLKIVSGSKKANHDRDLLPSGHPSKSEKTEKSSGAVPLYGFRPVLNAEEIVAWAQSSGLEKTLLPDDMHVTVVYSKTPFMSAPDPMLSDPVGMWADRRIIRGGKRTLDLFGSEKNALVLKLDSLDLTQEWLDHRRIGASWSWDGYQPHISLTYSAGPDFDVNSIEPFDGDIVLGPLTYRPIDPNWSDKVVEKSDPTTDAVHVPSTDWRSRRRKVRKAEGYLPPESARNNARRAIEWKKEHGDAVKGGTQVGWTRANQLSSGEKLSLDTVKRMAQFNRHRKNSEVAPEYKSEPWKDAGHVAWLLWGGTTGVDWAKSISERVEKRQVTDDLFTDMLGAMARSVDLGLHGDIHYVIVDGQLYYRPGEDEEDYVESLWPESEDEDETESEDESNGDLLDAAIRAILGAVMEKSNNISSSVSIIKADDEQRIVWGWVSVATEAGLPVYDVHGDHIPMEELTKASVDFMRNYRVGKTEHFGKQTSEVIALLPLSKSLADALGITTDREGLIAGFKVLDDATWSGVKSGDLPAFSIGGRGERHAAE